MPELTTPRTFLVGYTSIDIYGLKAYLEYTEQTEFMRDLEDALADGISPGQCLCSFYAKLCYAALTDKQNKNITRTRSIRDNLTATLAHGHGSVFEHCWLNFVTTGCSRVFTHELVRHRVGTAFSQTSGRYVRTDKLRFVPDPILDQCSHAVQAALMDIEANYKRLEAMVMQEPMDFAQKKKLTSALRRILPNGQANEIGWSCNLRTLRHLLMLRTNRHAEWEIRHVFAEVFRIVSHKYPLMFSDAKTEIVDGLPEVTGMVTQPYESTGG